LTVKLFWRVFCCSGKYEILGAYCKVQWDGWIEYEHQNVNHLTLRTRMGAKKSGNEVQILNSQS